MWTQRIAASWLSVNNARWQKETARLTKYVRSADIAEFTVACHDYIQNEKLNQGHVRNVSMVTFVLFNHCLLREVKTKYSPQQFKFRPYIRSFLLHAYMRSEGKFIVVSDYIEYTEQRSELIFSGWHRLFLSVDIC